VIGSKCTSCESIRMPKLTPAPITPATTGREALGQHSETSTTPLGHIPPTPSPTKNRKTSICSLRLHETAQAGEERVEQDAHAHSRVRPMRSPRLPRSKPPSAAPSIRLAVKRANQSPPRAWV